MQGQREITANEAINAIGSALAHESLKLSQGEHLTLVKCFKIVKEKLDKCNCEKEKIELKKEGLKKA